MARPTLIDLYPAETDADGVRVFRPFSETWMGQLTHLVIEYPREAGNFFGLVATGAMCAYFARRALQQDSAQKRSRR